MKDEEFQKKLESILKTLYDIDQQVEKYLIGKRLEEKGHDYKRDSYFNNLEVSDDKYEAKNSDGK